MIRGEVEKVFGYLVLKDSIISTNVIFLDGDYIFSAVQNYHVLIIEAESRQMILPDLASGICLRLSRM